MKSLILSSYLHSSYELISLLMLKLILMCIRNRYSFDYYFVQEISLNVIWLRRRKLLSSLSFVPLCLGEMIIKFRMEKSTLVNERWPRWSFCRFQLLACFSISFLGFNIEFIPHCQSKICEHFNFLLLEQNSRFDVDRRHILEQFLRFDKSLFCDGQFLITIIDLLKGDINHIWKYGLYYCWNIGNVIRSEGMCPIFGGISLSKKKWTWH